MAGKVEGYHEKKDLSKSWYEKDEADVQNVMHTIESLQIHLHIMKKKTYKHIIWSSSTIWN